MATRSATTAGEVWPMLVDSDLGYWGVETEDEPLAIVPCHSCRERFDCRCEEDDEEEARVTR
jgi:hypothetical protein